MTGDAGVELLAFFKALADSNRLKIIGLLAQQPYSVEQLAAILGLRPSTVSHHLSRLASVGLVSARADSYYNVYQLEEAALRKIHSIFSHQELPAFAIGLDAGAYDRKVLSDFTHPDGRLKLIPAQRKKREAVLRYVVKAFQPGKRFSEAEVNEILSRFHADVATLRRELVGLKLLERAGGGGDYWRRIEEAA